MIVQLGVFLFSVMIISLSGVLMPGPVTTVTVAKGAKHPLAGSLVALGHGVVEFPLIALIYFGVGVLFQKPPVKIGIGVLGGAFLLWMGIDMLRNFRKVEVKTEEKDMNPFVAGMILSAGNPYFLVWWATVGANLVFQSLAFGIMGLFLLAIFHWFWDLAWLQFLSRMSFQGGKFFGKKLQMGVFVVCGLAMIYFGLFFIVSALMTLSS